MDVVTKKVLAESWKALDLEGRYRSPVLIAGESAYDFSHEGGMSESGPYPRTVKDKDVARVRMAACAPEALRMLLEQETGDEGLCPWCSGPDRWHHSNCVLGLR